MSVMALEPPPVLLLVFHEESPGRTVTTAAEAVENADRTAIPTKVWREYFMLFYETVELALKRDADVIPARQIYAKNQPNRTCYRLIIWNMQNFYANPPIFAFPVSPGGLFNLRNRKAIRHHTGNHDQQSTTC